MTSRGMLVVAVTSILALANAKGQGSFVFSNGTPDVDAPVYDWDGTTRLSGSRYLVDYFWAPGTVVDPVELVDGGVAVPFYSGPDAGYFYGGTQVIPGQIGSITIQVRAWRASDGPNWTFAAMTTGYVGVGNLINISLATGNNPPPNLIGLRSFAIGVSAPEPSPFSLCLIALGAGVLRCHQKSRK